MRSYTLAEIDGMRAQLVRINKARTSAFEVVIGGVEDELRTYMQGGVDPQEITDLAAAAERERDAKRAECEHVFHDYRRADYGYGSQCRTRGQSDRRTEDRRSKRPGGRRSGDDPDMDIDPEPQMKTYVTECGIAITTEGSASLVRVGSCANHCKPRVRRFWRRG